jgi:hypothetical protein
MVGYWSVYSLARARYCIVMIHQVLRIKVNAAIDNVGVGPRDHFAHT